MPIIAGEVFVKAAVLSLILYLVARHEADFSLQKVALVVLGITLGQFLVEISLKPILGKFIANPYALMGILIIPIAGLVIVMLMQFCWVAFRPALIVTVIYLGCSLLLSAGSLKLRQKMDAVAEQNTNMPIQQSQNDLKEAFQILKEQSETSSQAFQSGPAHAMVKMATNAVPGLVATPTPVAPPPPTATPPPEPTPPPTVAGGRVLTVIHIADENSETGTAAKVASPVDWDGARKKLKTTGFMTGQGGQPMAVVNGRSVEKGNVIKVEHDGRTYRWKVRAVARSGVRWDQLDVDPPAEQ